MAQDFFAAFGHDSIGQIGTETTINSGDMAGILMIAVQALEKRTAELKQTKAELAALAARVEALEVRQNESTQKTAQKSDNSFTEDSREVAKLFSLQRSNHSAKVATDGFANGCRR